MRRRAFGILMAGVVTLAIAVPAFGANHTDTPDPNDTDGAFDLAGVALDHYPGPLRWTFRTFAGWTLASAWDRGYLVVELDTKGDKAIDERIVVRSDGERLVATLVTIGADGDERVRGTLDATKDSGRRASVEVALRRLALGRSRDAFTWYAWSLFTSSVCQRVCLDRVPDEGRLEQLLPGASPTPTPTPTPAPTGATGATGSS